MGTNEFILCTTLQLQSHIRTTPTPVTTSTVYIKYRCFRWRATQSLPSLPFSPPSRPDVKWTEVAWMIVIDYSTATSERQAAQLICRWQYKHHINIIAGSVAAQFFFSMGVYHRIRRDNKYWETEIERTRLSWTIKFKGVWEGLRECRFSSCKY